MALSKQVFTEAMMLLGTVYEKLRGITSNKEVLKAWYSVLNDMTDDELKAAVDDYVRTSKYAPVPADLWERVNAMREQQHPERSPGGGAGFGYRNIYNLVIRLCRNANIINVFGYSDCNIVHLLSSYFWCNVKSPLYVSLHVTA